MSQTSDNDYMEDPEEIETFKAPGPRAKSTLFDHFCREILQKLEHLKSDKTTLPGKKRQKAADLIKEYFEAWRRGNDDNLYPLLQLLLPGAAKRVYNLKEGSLGKVMVKVFFGDVSSRRADSIINWQNADYGSHRGDLGMIAYVELQAHRVGIQPTLTIEQVNDYLSRMSSAPDAKEMKEIYMQMITKATALEIKWTTRIILKELHIEASEKTVLKNVHPEAVDLFDKTKDLLRVAYECREPGPLRFKTIRLGCAFTPMLSEALGFGAISKTLTQPDYVVETKYDGDRMLLHYEQGKPMKFFSRSGKDFSEEYRTGGFEDRLVACLAGSKQSKVRNCILDGEMVKYNKETREIVSRGVIGTGDVKTLDGTGTIVRCFIAFDIVFLNGNPDGPLAAKPLRERRRLLEDHITPCAGLLQLSRPVNLRSTEELTRMMDEAIDHREEGLIIKDANSLYEPSKRDKGWFKLKHDYDNQTIDDLDVTIVGAYLARGRRQGGMVNAFLVGVCKRSEQTKGETPVFYALARVGGGFNSGRLDDITKKLEGHLVDSKKNNLPPFLVIDGPTPKADIWPDKFIDHPDNSVVIQVRAAEIVESDTYASGNTMRFPRCKEIRFDKTWQDANTFEEVAKFCETGGTRRRMSEQERGKKKQRTTPKKEGVLFGLSIKLDTVAPKTEIFKDLELAVFEEGFGMDKKKAEWERLIAENGGELVSLAGRRTAYIISRKMWARHQSVKKDITSIVLPDWLHACVRAGKIVPVHPKWVLSATAALTEEMSQYFSKYQVAYTTDTENLTLKLPVEELSENIRKYREANAKKEQDLSPEHAERIMAKYCKAYQRSSFLLLNTYIYVDRYAVIGDMSTEIPFSDLESLEALIISKGGTLVDNMAATTRVTYVLIDPTDMSRVDELKRLRRGREKKFSIVTEEWLEACIRDKELHDAASFPDCC